MNNLSAPLLFPGAHALVAFALTLIFCKQFFYPFMKRRAWNVQIGKDGSSTGGNQATEKAVRGFFGPGPGWDARGQLQLVTHSLAYWILAIGVIVRFPFVMLRHWLAVLSSTASSFIADVQVFEMATDTSMVLLGEWTADNVYVFRMDPQSVPPFHEYYNGESEGIPGIDLQSLAIEFRVSPKPGKKRWDVTIIRAHSRAGEVEGKTRNEKLMASLFYIANSWVHAAVHKAAEANALEIQSKRIEMLEPSVHYVSSLHEGLLHSWGSPISRESPFQGHSLKADVMTTVTDNYTVPHGLQTAKEAFPIYHFAVKSRKIIFRLVREFNLDVNPENLFLNLVFHALDHARMAKVCDQIDLMSIDGTGSLYSKWQYLCYKSLWVAHVDNPLNSDKMTAFLDRPFYGRLFAELNKIEKVPKEYIDSLLVSCCF